MKMVARLTGQWQPAAGSVMHLSLLAKSGADSHSCGHGPINQKWMAREPLEEKGFGCRVGLAHPHERRCQI